MAAPDRRKRKKKVVVKTLVRVFFVLLLLSMLAAYISNQVTIVALAGEVSVATHRQIESSCERDVSAHNRHAETSETGTRPVTAMIALMFHQTKASGKSAKEVKGYLAMMSSMRMSTRMSPTAIPARLAFPCWYSIPAR